MSASHETSDHSHESAPHTGQLSSKSAFISSFWFVVILVGLFIAALNFISAMSGDEHGEGHLTQPTREASASGTLSGETGVGVAATDTTQHFDTARHDIATGVGH